MLALGRHDVLVEGNHFDNFLRKSAIRIKSIGNIVRHNSVRYDRQTVAGMIASRHGSDNLLAFNRMTRSTGIQIFENDNAAIGNELDGDGRILVMAGAGEITRFGTRQQHRASDTLVDANRGALVVGFQWRQDDVDPAIGTRVSRHRGPITLAHESGTIVA